MHLFRVSALLLCGYRGRFSRHFDTLSGGSAISGFQTVSVYADAAGHLFGARFRHGKSGFTLDLIQLQAVPAGLHLHKYTRLPTKANPTPRSTF